MEITNELGQEIIKRLIEYIDVDINIMDLDGKIVASTDKARINELHSGAIEVIRSNNSLILNEKNVQQFPGTKSGVNLPIMHQNKISGVVGVSGSPSEILRITGLIRVSVEMVIEQIYTQRQAYFKERQWNNWLHKLLHPSGYEEAKLEEEAAYTLKITTKANWRVIIICGMDVQNSIDEIRREIKSLKTNTLFTLPFAEDEIIIVVSSTLPAIERLTERFAQKEFRIGIGEEAFDIRGIRQSYHQAKQALSFNGGIDKVSYSENWKIERLTTSVSDTEYNNICLKYERRLEDLGTEYIRTIDTYFKMNFSVKETAKLLHIHRNTLLYRLDQVSEKVQLDPRVFHDAFLLKMIRSRMKI